MSKKTNTASIERVCYNRDENLHIENKITEFSKLPLSLHVTDLLL
jgi:hypothetical protein